MILFLDPSRKPIEEKGKTYTPREYFIRQDYPPIQSRLLEIIEKYPIPDDSQLDEVWVNGDSIWPDELRRALRQFGSAVLHALMVLPAGNDEETINRISNHLLLNVQKPEKKEEAKLWLRRWVSFYRRVPLEKEELRPIAMQVGLPIRSVQRLYARLAAKPDFIELFRAGNSSSAILSQEQISNVANVIAEIEELDWYPTEAPHNQLIAAWTTGATIAVLSELYKPHMDSQSRFMEKTCNYAMQQLSNAGAWGAYALARILELILGDELSPIAKRLPLLIYFGVNLTPAALLSLIGIERIDALRLGAAFIADGNDEATIQGLKTWAKRKGAENLQGILRGTDEREIDQESLTILLAA